MKSNPFTESLTAYRLLRSIKVTATVATATVEPMACDKVKWVATKVSC